MMSRVVTFVVASMIAVACGGKPPPPKAPPPVSSRCPDLSKPDEIAAFDLAKEYVLSQDAADKLKAAALAAVEIHALADKLDADFGMACARIAQDLGDKGDWRSGNDACAAAIKAVQQARAKLGPKARTELVVSRPACLADEALVTKCASICDSSVPAEKIRAECEARAGRCDGDCDGWCEPKGSIGCDGDCSGTCEGPMKGTCGGRCVGTCDGKRSRGACLGTCVGTCDRGPIRGECKGACSGACNLAKAGICDGTCSGSCSVDFTDPKCAGDFKAPDVSADCRARCDLAVLNHTACSTPEVGLVVTGAKDRDAEAFTAAVAKSFPALLQILYEIGEGGPKRVLDARAVLEGARAGFADMARSGSAATAMSAERQLVKCFDEPLKNAAALATTLKAGIDAALAIREEAAVGSATPVASAPQGEIAGER